MLNTEAHPFPRFDASKKRFKTGWKRIPRDEKGNLVREKGEEGKVVTQVVTQVVKQSKDSHPGR